MPPAPYLFYDKKGVGTDHGGYTGQPPVAPVTSSSLPVLPEGATSLHFALGNMKRPDIQKLLQQNPEAVQEKGTCGDNFISYLKMKLFA
jgi:hypothetical protein